MRVLKILKILALAILSLISLIAVTALLIVVKPSLVVNERTVSWGAQFVTRFGVHVDWKRSQVEASSVSLFRKKFLLNWTDLCVDLKDPKSRACFSRFKIAAVIDFSRLKPKIIEVGPIEVLDGDLEAHLVSKPETTAAKPAPKKSSGPGLLSWFEGATIQPSRIDIDRWEISQAKNTFRGSLKLASDREKNLYELVANAKAKVILAGRTQGDYRLDLNLRNFGEFWVLGNWTLGANAQARMYDPKKPPAWARAQIVARSQGEGLRTVISAQSKNLVPGITRASVEDCELVLKRSLTTLNCPIDVRVPIPTTHEFPDLKVPTHAAATVSAELHPKSFPPSLSELVEGKVGVEISPILTPLFHGQGHATADVRGIPSEFPKNWKIDSEVAAEMKVPSFENLVDHLETTAWAIPAPLQVLRGSVAFSLQGSVDLNEGRVPVQFLTRLRSGTQAMNIDSSGKLSFSKAGATLGLDVALSEIKLNLPKLDLGSPPRFFPDPRFQLARASKKVSSKKGEPSFKYKIHVHTNDDSPVRVTSNLAKADVPITLDLSMTETTPIAGSVHVGEFPLDLFRRDAKIDHFDIDLSDPIKESPIDGQFAVEYADYTIYVQLISSLDKPVIRFSSDPPLPEDQILSTLLFGQPLETLDPQQASSVGSTQAALAEGVVGLVPLYLLASTPVQNVGYDPTTRTLFAKVKLAEGTSLNLGMQGGDVSNVGVRRRLGSHWSIETAVEKNATTEGRNLSAMLQWSNRY